jgi:hypothetical protein
MAATHEVLVARRGGCWAVIVDGHYPPKSYHNVKDTAVAAAWELTRGTRASLVLDLGQDVIADAQRACAVPGRAGASAS